MGHPASGVRATGVVCLQGGSELTAACRPMDTELLQLAPDGPVVVVALASEPGADYSRTTANAARYFADLGAEVEVPADPRRGADEALQQVAAAGLVFMTGGSPRRLRDALVATGVGDAITARAQAGGVIVGSSAGAMVACATTLLPQWRGRPDAGPGLGLVQAAVVVPHYDGKRKAWVEAGLSVEPAVLGIPECSGVVMQDGEMRRVGVEAPTLITASRGGCWVRTNVG